MEPNPQARQVSLLPHSHALDALRFFDGIQNRQEIGQPVGVGKPGFFHRAGQKPPPIVQTLQKLMLFALLSLELPVLLKLSKIEISSSLNMRGML
jgi:hypothetical protein